MGFHEDFQASIESLPAILHRHYGTMRDLDKSLQGVQRQNEQRCEQEIQEIRRGIESGNIIPDRSHIRFSDEALDEQKHCIRIADEKVALATLAYDLAFLDNTIEICGLITSEQTRGGDWKHHKDCVHTSLSISVDEQICQLDQYMRKLESLRQEKELAVSGGATALNSDGTPRSARATESSRGGRKKSKVLTPVEQPSMDFELPVDPNEPTYCICNQVSWGEMIACDNPDCKIEWFHFQCVGLKEHPKGKWYCSSCVGLPKRRKGK